MKYKDLGLVKDTSVTTFDFQGIVIEVQKYLPIEDKYDLIMVTLQKSFEKAFYNAIKLDMYFHLNLVYLYTNLEFTEDERENETELYDILKSSGFIDELLKYIPEREYSDLFQFLNDIMEEDLKASRSAGVVLKNLVADLPLNAETAAKIVDNFDTQKFKNVVDFAQAANGGRPIK